MSSGDFLSRWSRRKREQAAEAEARAQKSSVAPEDPSGAPPADVVAAAEGLTNEELAEKLKALPGIEDLTPEHDLTAFMQAWVPDDLRNRALRKMWSVDPAIRDFIAPESERYDFDKPGAMFSHGPINMSADELKAAAERMLGSWRKVDPEKEEQPASSERAGEDAGGTEPTLEADDRRKERSDAAPPEPDLSSAETAPDSAISNVRRHGGAAPK